MGSRSKWPTSISVLSLEQNFINQYSYFKKWILMYLISDSSVIVLKSVFFSCLIPSAKFWIAAKKWEHINTIPLNYQQLVPKNTPPKQNYKLQRHSQYEPAFADISAWYFYRSNITLKIGFIILMQQYWDKLKTINGEKDTTSNAFTCLNQFCCFDTPSIFVYIYPSETQNKHITQRSLYI